MEKNVNLWKIPGFNKVPNDTPTGGPFRGWSVQPIVPSLVHCFYDFCSILNMSKIIKGVYMLVN